jgi:hypothetical protein
MTITNKEERQQQRQSPFRELSSLPGISISDQQPFQEEGAAKQRAYLPSTLQLPSEISSSDDASSSRAQHHWVSSSNIVSME